VPLAPGASRDKPAFRDAWKRGQRAGKKEQAYAIGTADDFPMVMAGLWETWKSPRSGEEIVTCTVITREPNTAMGELHDRMPAILGEADWPKWLGEEPTSEEELFALLRPCPDEALKIWPVDSKVDNIRNTGPQLIIPLEPTPV
jgi:putative SOS response-associated peptidase YedK